MKLGLLLCATTVTADLLVVNVYKRFTILYELLRVTPTIDVFLYVLVG